MSATVKFDEDVSATVDDSGHWTADDADLQAYLEAWTDEIGRGPEQGHLPTLLSTYAVEELGAELVNLDPPEAELEPGRVY